MKQELDQTIAISLAAMAFVGFINGVYVSVLARNSTLLFWLADLAHWIILPTLLLRNLWQKHGIAPAQFGFALPTINLKWLAVVLAASLTLHLAFVLSLYGAEHLFGDMGRIFSLANAMPKGRAGDIAWVYSAVTAGVVESAFFIGLPWLLWTRLKTGGLFGLIGSVLAATTV